MAESPAPKFTTKTPDALVRVQCEPVTGPGGVVRRLKFLASLVNPALPRGGALCIQHSGVLARDAIRIARIWDSLGDLPCDKTDEPGLGNRVWAVSRATSGAVFVSYEARPPPAQPANLPVDVFSLANDQGGVVGTCAPHFLPDRPSYQLRISFEAVPRTERHTVASSTGPSSGNTIADKMAANEAIFAAGPQLRRSPPEDKSPKFGMYWNGDAPKIFTDWADSLADFADQMSRLFTGAAGAGEPFSIFLRRGPKDTRTQMELLRRAVLITYSDDLGPSTPGDVFHKLARVIALQWLKLDGPNAENPDHDRPFWFDEGFADFLAVFPPYPDGTKYMDMLQVLTNEYYTHPFNEFLSPFAGMPGPTSTDWKSAQALERLRGFLHLLSLDVRMRSDTKLERSVYDCLREVYIHKNVLGEHVPIAGWVIIVKAAWARDHQVGSGMSYRNEVARLMQGQGVELPANGWVVRGLKPFAYEDTRRELGFDEGAVYEYNTIWECQQRYVPEDRMHIIPDHKMPKPPDRTGKRKIQALETIEEDEEDEEEEEEEEDGDDPDKRSKLRSEFDKAVAYNKRARAFNADTYENPAFAAGVRDGDGVVMLPGFKLWWGEGEAMRMTLKDGDTGEEKRVEWSLKGRETVWCWGFEELTEDEEREEWKEMEEWWQEADRQKVAHAESRVQRAAEKEEHARKKAADAEKKAKKKAAEKKRAAKKRAEMEGYEE